MSGNENKEPGHGKPPVSIYVNTREFEWAGKTIGFDQVYNLAFPNAPLSDGDVARIEYSRGRNGGGAGSLQRGETANVKPDMTFDVYVTVRS